MPQSSELLSLLADMILVYTRGYISHTAGCTLYRTATGMVLADPVLYPIQV